MEGNFDGWIPVNETWTYASADSPTFTFTVSGDKTNKYSLGMRIKLTQTSVKYFIITAVSYSNPNTTITVYGGTDYTLANATITAPYYSEAKAPQGFPLDPAKWTVRTTNTSDNIQGNPTQNTWYNLGSVNIIIPIGTWRVIYQVATQINDATAGTYSIRTTLSTTNNGETDSEFSTYSALYVSTACGAYFTREKHLNLSSKTTYYLNTQTSSANVDNLANLGAESQIIIEAISAYL